MALEAQFTEPVSIVTTPTMSDLIKTVCDEARLPKTAIVRLGLDLLFDTEDNKFTTGDTPVAAVARAMAKLKTADLVD